MKLAEQVGIGAPSDFNEFSENELVDEHGFDVEHVRRILAEVAAKA